MRIPLNRLCARACLVLLFALPRDATAQSSPASADSIFPVIEFARAPARTTARPWVASDYRDACRLRAKTHKVFGFASLPLRGGMIAITNN